MQMVDHPGKLALYKQGVALVTEFCRVNRLRQPRIELGTQLFVDGQRVAGRYTPGLIQVWLAKCHATCGEQNRWLWDYPGSTKDVTPLGVLAHEAGHHVWANRSKLRKGWTQIWQQGAQITAHEDTDATGEEAFAETVRLYITNPDLLRRAFGARYAFLKQGLWPVCVLPSEVVLNAAPERVQRAALNKCRSLL